MVRLGFLILILGMLSCKSQKGRQSIDDSDDGLTLLVQDGYSGIEAFESMVIRDQKTLNGFFAKINRTRKPGIPVPQIDFSKEMVVVICAGEQEGTEMPRLSKVDENAEEIVLAVDNLNPVKDVGTSLISSPFCVYKIPVTDRKITFQK
ncbi:hypothetical protein [Allomuricauda sp. SCSIO 65647]|uniref:hypothetical protein n=1 Tax=Allomuricauda sp. SCSIO 65647 TaxID=2908843 RepID=UPI001F2DC9AE|nr:hypothetical protein [Muricauda sp. SCSIO 65647]UJH67000.1 hypothetical protein L0P89_13705 [Muricauda sp. SCSIO 65647]